MKKWIVTLIVTLTLFISTGLLAQEVIPPGEGPGRRSRLIDFDTLGKVTATDEYLANENWRARLNDSANYTQNMRLTYTRNVRGVDGNKNYLGIRVNFPNFSNNAYANIIPPLRVPFYGSPASGVLTNVGALKSVLTRVAGRNYPYRVSANIQRSDGEVVHAPFGSIEYLGWRDLQYDNPEYIEDLKYRTLTITPAYPRILPSLRFNDMSFFRNGELPISGDFVTYVAWVDVIYDYAFSEVELEELRQSEDYIDDEATWQILSNELGKVEAQLLQEKLDRFRYLEKLERDKMNLPSRTSVSAPTPAQPQQ